MVEFVAREMQPRDVQYVVDRAWSPGTEELKRIGTNPHSMVGKFIEMADYGWTFFVENEPIAICGAQRLDNTHYTWFMGTPAMEKFGREFTQWLRKFCKEKVQEEGVALEMYSASLHPNSDRWFAALGFERAEEDIGIYRHYRYARKNKLTMTE